MIEEASRRRPGFAPGIPVKMADGQCWELPRPTVDLAPKFGDDGEMVLTRMTSLGPGFDGLLEELAGTAAWTDTLLVTFKIGAHLLRANYELSGDELATLLRYRTGDDAGDDQGDMVEAIITVAAGRSPKA